MPFDTGAFFEVFARYNLTVWPAQIVLTASAVVAVVLALRRRPWSGRVISLILGSLWVWMGSVYHLGFYRSINPAATLFGMLFLLEGALLLTVGGWRGRLEFGWRRGVAGVAGAAMVGYAFVAYPLLGQVLGHRYPAAPTFGLPCPTTILTLGLLAWAAPGSRWTVAAIPLAWSAVASVAAVRLGMWEDLGLVLAGLILGLLILRPWLVRPRSAGGAFTA